MTRDLVKKKKTNPPLRSKWMYSQDRKKKLRMDGSIWRTAHWVEIKYQKERENGNSLAFFAEMFFLHYKVGKKKKKRERERSATFLYSNTAGWIVKVNWSENPLSFCCAAPGLEKESRGNPGDGRTTTTIWRLPEKQSWVNVFAPSFSGAAGVMIERVIEGEREVKEKWKGRRPHAFRPFILNLFLFLPWICVCSWYLSLFGCRTWIRGNMLCTPQLPFRRKP